MSNRCEFHRKHEDGHANIFGFDDSPRMGHETLMCLRADGLECVAAGGSVHAVLDGLLVGVMELFDNAVAAVMLRPNSAHPMALVATQSVPIACVEALRTAVNQRTELVSDTHAQVIADVQDEPR